MHNQEENEFSFTQSSSAHLTTICVTTCYLEVLSVWTTRFSFAWKKGLACHRIENVTRPSYSMMNKTFKHET